MGDLEHDTIHIGHVTVPLGTAAKWVSEYTSERNKFGRKGAYAFPAYDFYDSGNVDPKTLNDADLLAPTLLNVPPKVRSFYGLQLVRSQLEDALTNEVLNLHLADAPPEDIEAAVAPFYALLDNPATKPWGVNATTLSKVIHRKRPQFLVLHDKWVRGAYVGPKGPVQPDKHRSWADYMVAVSQAIANDLRGQAEAFAKLRAGSPASQAATDVRILDILAWNCQGQSVSAKPTK